MSPGTLEYRDGPLIWIDCEMTGLNAKTDRIIEIAVIITNGHLEPVDEGINYIIQTPKEVLDQMDEWCTNQHGKSGLTQACIDSPNTIEDVTQKVMDYVKKWVPNPKAGLLAGSSVHADKTFLVKEMPLLVKHLSYRILDVSSIKEVCRRWFPSMTLRQTASRQTTEVAHRALDDIKGSIRELKWYRDNIFIPLENATSTKSDEAAQAKTNETSSIDQVTEALEQSSLKPT